MTIPAILLVPAATGLIGYAAWVAFVGLPADMRSLFRHKMWRIRDAAMDDIIFGRVPDNQQNRQIIVFAELLIAFVDNLTLAKILFGLIVPTIFVTLRERRKNHPRPVQQPVTPQTPSPLFPVIKAMLLFLLTGSMSGWVALVFALPVMFLVKVWIRAVGTAGKFTGYCYQVGSIILNYLESFNPPPQNPSSLLVT